MKSTPQGTSLPDERRAFIVQELSKGGSLRVADLVEMLGVTPVTIRRDLNLLQEQKIVTRVHGGVTLDRAINGKPSTRSSAALTLIGMVVPSLDYYWPSVARGAEEQAASRGMKVVLRKSDYWSLEEDWIQVKHLVEQVGVKGLLLSVNMLMEGSEDLLQWVAEHNVPVVLVERQGFYQSTGEPVESVISDHLSGGVVAIKHLLDLGHEKIGFVINRGSPTGEQLRGTWAQASEKFGISPEPTFFSEIDSNDPKVLDNQIEEIIDECLAAGATAIVIHADQEANALVQHCQLRGLRVPEDLSIVAYDDEVASMFTPPLTAVRPPRTSVGESALDLLWIRLTSPEQPIRRLVLNPRISIRESTTFPRP